MSKSETFVDQIRQFNQLAGNTTNTFNARQSALYMGMQLEELAEKLAHLGFTTTSGTMQTLGRQFKQGGFDDLFSAVDRTHLIDDDVDLIVVTIGSMLSQGVDIEGALSEVSRSNMSKVFPDGTLHKDDNGKIVKSPEYTAPDLRPFVCKFTK